MNGFRVIGIIPYNDWFHRAVLDSSIPYTQTGESLSILRGHVKRALGELAIRDTRIEDLEREIKALQIKKRQVDLSLSKSQDELLASCLVTKRKCST